MTVVLLHLSDKDCLGTTAEVGASIQGLQWLGKKREKGVAKVSVGLLHREVQNLGTWGKPFCI